MKRAATRTALFLLAVSLTAMVLAGCGQEATPTAASEFEAYVSTSLDAGYEDALPASSQLVLGILMLEETETAVTPEQAATLLPLWQSLQGSALQGQAEVNAVLAQIERSMTSEQLAAIAAMQLNGENLAAWMQQQGIAMGPGGPGGDVPAGELPAGGEYPAGGWGSQPEARQTQRAQMESLSDEERAQRIAELQATAQAGGMTFGGAGGPGGRAGMETGTGWLGPLLQPLIDLLTQRAGA